VDLLGVEEEGQGEGALEGVVPKPHGQGHHQRAIKDVQKAKKAKAQGQGPPLLQKEGREEGGKPQPEEEEPHARKEKREPRFPGEAQEARSQKEAQKKGRRQAQKDPKNPLQEGQKGAHREAQEKGPLLPGGEKGHRQGQDQRGEEEGKPGVEAHQAHPFPPALEAQGQKGGQEEKARGPGVAGHLLEEEGGHGLGGGGKKSVGTQGRFSPSFKASFQVRTRPPRRSGRSLRCRSRFSRLLKARSPEPMGVRTLGLW
jgi:hypothetical protein